MDLSHGFNHPKLVELKTVLQLTPWFWMDQSTLFPLATLAISWFTQDAPWWYLHAVCTWKCSEMSFQCTKIPSHGGFRKPLVNFQRKLWKITMLLMGKSTINGHWYTYVWLIYLVLIWWIPMVNHPWYTDFHTPVVLQPQVDPLEKLTGPRCVLIHTFYGLLERLSTYGLEQPYLQREMDKTRFSKGKWWVNCDFSWFSPEKMMDDIDVTLQ
jgi:hypothetical protein